MSFDHSQQDFDKSWSFGHNELICLAVTYLEDVDRRGSRILRSYNAEASQVEFAFKRFDRSRLPIKMSVAKGQVPLTGLTAYQSCKTSDA